MIDGKVYEADASLQPLFTDKNAAVLENADIEVTIRNNEITNVTALTLNRAGTLNGQIDAGKNVTIDQLTVNADGITLKNMNVKNDIILTDNVVEEFNVNKVAMNNLITPDTRAVQQVEKPATRLKITFTDSTVVYMEIKKVDTLLSVHGATQISLLAVESNSSIVTDPDVVLPKLKIYRGVTQIELNASIAQVEIETNDDIEVTGKGNFDEVQVKTEKSVTLKTEGTIKSLSSDSQNITLGTDVKINKTVDSNNQEKLASEMISNYEEVKDNIKSDASEPGQKPDVEEPSNPNYIAAKLILDQAKFGYAALSVINADGRDIYYRLVENSNLVKGGEPLPSETIRYHEGDQFIPWATLDVEVYVVDEQQKVVDSYSIDIHKEILANLVKVEFVDGKIRIQTILSKSDLRFSSFYFAQGNQFHYAANPRSYKFEIDPQTGFPTLDIAIPDDFKIVGNVAMSFYYTLHSDTTGIGYYDYLISTGNRMQTDLNALKNLAQINIKENTGENYYYETIFNRYAYEQEPIYNEQGKIISYNYIRLMKPVLLFKYLEAIKVANIYTQGDFKQLVQKVNSENEDLVKQFGIVSRQVNALFVEDHIDYPYYERLAMTTTQETIDAAKQAVNTLNLPAENNYKQSLLREIENAESILREITSIQQLQNYANQYINEQSYEAGYQIERILTRFNEQQYKLSLFEKYVEQLKTQGVQTPAQLQALVKDVNGQHPNLVKQQQQFDDLVATLFVKNQYQVAEIERLVNVERAPAQIEQLKTLQSSFDSNSKIISEIDTVIYQAENVLKLVNTIANNHELAKKFVVGEDFEAENVISSLLYSVLGNGEYNLYNYGLLPFYIEELAANAYTTPVAIKGMLTSVNEKYANQLVQYKEFEAQIQGLVREDEYQYKAFNRLKNPATAESELAEILQKIEQSSLVESLKNQLQNRAGSITWYLDSYKAFTNLQSYADTYLNNVENPIDNDAYSKASNGLRNLFSNIVEYNQYNHQLLNLYVTEVKTKPQWTLDELVAMIAQVTENNRTTLSTETVQDPEVALFEQLQASFTENVELEEPFTEVVLPEPVETFVQPIITKEKVIYKIGENEFEEATVYTVGE